MGCVSLPNLNAVYIHLFNSEIEILFMCQLGILSHSSLYHAHSYFNKMVMSSKKWPKWACSTVDSDAPTVCLLFLSINVKWCPCQLSVSFAHMLNHFIQNIMVSAVAWYSWEGDQSTLFSLILGSSVLISCVCLCTHIHCMFFTG